MTIGEDMNVLLFKVANAFGGIGKDRQVRSDDEGDDRECSEHANTHQAASRRFPSDAISLLKSKSVAALPVISRAPRLNVRSSMAHSMNTVRRLRNCTIYMR